MSLSSAIYTVTCTCLGRRQKKEPLVPFVGLAAPDVLRVQKRVRIALQGRNVSDRSLVFLSSILAQTARDGADLGLILISRGRLSKH